jgi:hypothetical protein
VLRERVNQGAAVRSAMCAPEPLQLELERVRAHAAEEARRQARADILHPKPPHTTPSPPVPRIIA